VEIFDSTGELIWSIKEPDATSFVLSDAVPRAVGVVGAEGLPRSELQLYSTAGELQGNVTVQHLLEIRYSSTGDYLFINSANTGLRAYNISGDLVCDYGLASGFCVSEDGRHVAVTNASGISYFMSGVKIKSLAVDPDGLNSIVDMQFDFELSLLAVLHKDGLSVYRLPAMEFAWEERHRSGSRRFTSLDCSPIGLLAVGYDVPSEQSGRKMHTKGGVTLFDSAGSRLHDLELSYANWTHQFPAVCFTGDGRELRVATADEAVTFTVSR
jgi:hypothetical protein